MAKSEPGKYRIVQAAMHYNKVTWRDANLPFNPDEFAELFAGQQISTLINIFSKYDQCTLAEDCRDFTTFMTPLGLLRVTIIPMGGTNSVGQFVRIVMVMFIGMLDIMQSFLDDFGIRGPKDYYDD